MGIKTEKYVRKPLFVKAVRVTEENFDECVAWCQGEVETDGAKKFIRVRVHNPNEPRQTKAFVGDWILWHEKGYKIYTHKAFIGVFDLVVTEEEKVVTPPVSEPITEELKIPEEAGGRAKLDVGGKRIITREEAIAMTSYEVQELLRSGEAVLEEDLAA
jgi:hypothetical protein